YLTKSIEVLIKNDLVNESWVIYRSLLDRLVYLIHLRNTDQFQSFDDWSFRLKYEYNNNAKSDETIRQYQPKIKFTPDDENKARYKKLIKEKPKFNKPDPKTVLKNE